MMIPLIIYPEIYPKDPQGPYNQHPRSEAPNHQQPRGFHGKGGIAHSHEVHHLQ
jgi:hypothetical protein